MAAVTAGANSSRCALPCSCVRLSRCCFDGEGCRGGILYSFCLRCPVVFVVVLDCQLAQDRFSLQLGAVDILQKPVSSQTGRLGTLWQHTLRKRSSPASTAREPDSCNTNSGAGSTAAEPTVCTAGDDLVKAILPDLFESDLWDEQTITGTSGEHGSSIDTPETPDISHHLRQDYSSSQSLLSCYPSDFNSVHSGSSPNHEHMVKAHSVNSALSPVLVPQVRTPCSASDFSSKMLHVNCAFTTCTCPISRLWSVPLCFPCNQEKHRARQPC